MDFLNDTNKPAKLNRVHLLPPSCLTKSGAFPQLSMGAAGKYKWLSAPPDKTSAGLLQSLNTIDRWRWSLSLNFCCESFEIKISWKGTKLSKLIYIFTEAYMQYVYWQAGKTHFQRNFHFLDLWVEREFYWQYWKRVLIACIDSLNYFPDSVFEAQGALNGNIKGVCIMTLECAMLTEYCQSDHAPQDTFGIYTLSPSWCQKLKDGCYWACWCFTMPTPLLRIGNTSKSATITPTAITLVITQWGRRSTVESSNTSHFLDHKLRCWGPTKTFTFLKLFLLFFKVQTYIHNCRILERNCSKSKTVCYITRSSCKFLNCDFLFLCILICTKPELPLWSYFEQLITTCLSLTLPWILSLSKNLKEYLK